MKVSGEGSNETKITKITGLSERPGPTFKLPKFPSCLEFPAVHRAPPWQLTEAGFFPHRSPSPPQSPSIVSLGFLSRVYAHKLSVVHLGAQEIKGLGASAQQRTALSKLCFSRGLNGAAIPGFQRDECMAHPGAYEERIKALLLDL